MIFVYIGAPFCWALLTLLFFAYLLKKMFNKLLLVLKTLLNRF